ncbi:peptidase inhibitor family I36 protein [Streptomyces sp. NPDC020965]|uniref:peptidase inhibitor family I36 protein n=1 Tax=Streptomyces sp. NPDC020965 TaxID=3365105 RepID=UPI0037B80C5E
MMDTQKILMTTGSRTLTRWSPRRRVLPGLLAAVATAVIGGLATAAPATANEGNCTAVSALCLYSGENFSGTSLPITSQTPGGTCVNVAQSGWSGPVRSVVNTHSKSAALFMNEDCLGGPYQVAANSSIPSLGTFQPKSLWVAG